MVFTDNVGKIFAGLMRPLTQNSAKQITIVDINNVTQNVWVYTASSNSLWWGGTNEIQVGDGNTPADPLDYNIESPFTNGGIEDNRKVMALPTYTLGSKEIIQNANIAPTAGGGSIEEICQFKNGHNNGGTDIWYLICRNVITAVPFTAGASLNLEAEVTF